MNKELLFNTLSKYKIVKYDDILFCEVDYSNISFYRLREAFYYLGIVLEEDEDKSICVAKIKSGFLNQNETVIAAQTHKSSISFALYSEEGIIKQKSSEKTLNLILERLKNPKAPKKNGKKIFGSIFIVILLGLGIFIAPKLFSLNKATELTKAYNTSICEYNNSIDDYNALAKQADLSNVDNFIVKAKKIPTVEEDKLSVFYSLLKGNKVSSIEADTKTLKQMKSTLENNSTIINSIINPSEDWVISKIKDCNFIDSVKAVTQDNDPNNLLGKDGGYTGAIYFTINKLTEDKNVDPVKLGTNCGGCIEIYKNTNDAKQRCEYLKQFDNSFLQTGSYTTIGTLVVRTSYQLEVDSQYFVTNKIFKALTSI